MKFCILYRYLPLGFTTTTAVQIAAPVPEIVDVNSMYACSTYSTPYPDDLQFIARYLDAIETSLVCDIQGRCIPITEYGVGF
jgi:hypothetical protein